MSNTSAPCQVSQLTALFQQTGKSASPRRARVQRTNSHSDRFNQAKARFQSQGLGGSCNEPLLRKFLNTDQTKVNNLSNGVIVTEVEVDEENQTDFQSKKSTSLGSDIKQACGSLESFVANWRLTPTNAKTGNRISSCSPSVSSFPAPSPKMPIFSSPAASSFSSSFQGNKASKPVARVTPVTTVDEFYREDEAISSAAPHNEGVESKEERRENNFENTIVPLIVEAAEKENEESPQLLKEISERSPELSESYFKSRTNEEVKLSKVVREEVESAEETELNGMSLFDDTELTKYEGQFAELMDVSEGLTSYCRSGLNLSDLDLHSKEKGDNVKKSDSLKKMETCEPDSHEKVKDVENLQAKVEDSLSGTKPESQTLGFMSNIVQPDSPPYGVPEPRFCDNDETKPSATSSSLGSSLVGESVSSWLGQSSDSLLNDLPDARRKSVICPTPPQNSATTFYDQEAKVHYLADGHYWFETSPLRSEEEEVPGPSFKKPSRLSFSREPIKQFSTHSLEEYDRTNEWIDPVTASVEWEMEKRMDQLLILEVVLERKNEEGLGFSVMGVEESSTECGVPEKLSIFVKKVAQSGQVKVGDQIIEVNGVSLVGVTQAFAASVLSNTSELIRLVLGREKKSPEVESLEVSSLREEDSVSSNSSSTQEENEENMSDSVDLVDQKSTDEELKSEEEIVEMAREVMWRLMKEGRQLTMEMVRREEAVSSLLAKSGMRGELPSLTIKPFASDVVEDYPEFNEVLQQGFRSSTIDIDL